MDKKLLYKVERTSAAGSAEDDGNEKTPETKATDVKSSKTGKKKKKETDAAETEEKAAPNEDIRLLIRLGFSGHEKLTEERWVQRIPSEEPFREASPEIVKPGEEKFEATERQFEELD